MTSNATDTGKTAAAITDGTKVRVHSIKLDKLVIRKIDGDREAWLKGADRIARAVLKKELREGEGFQVQASGWYRLVFPKLTDEAGALRMAVLREMVAREIRKHDVHISPSESERSDPEETSRAEPAPARHIARMPSSTPQESLAAHDQAMRVAATRALANMVAPTVNTDDPSLTDADRDALASAKLTFHPIWHAKNKMITGYHCRLANADGDIGMRDLRESLGQYSSEMANAKIDALVYQEAIRTLQWLVQQGKTALFIIPIHFSTIERQRLITQIMNAEGSLPPKAVNLIVFEVLDMPPHVSRFRLRDPVSYLRRRCRALIARLSFESSDLEALKQAGFYGVGVNLHEASFNENNAISVFAQFAAAAEKYGLQSWVQSVNSNSVNVAALAAGCTYLDGSIISAPASHPSHIRPMEIDMLYGPKSAPEIH